MTEQAENLVLLAEYEELLRYCPVPEADLQTVQGLDRQTLRILSSTARYNCEKTGYASGKAYA